MKPGFFSRFHISMPVLIMVILTTIFVLIIGLMSVMAYEQTHQHLMNEWDNEVSHNAQYLQNTLQLINQGLLLFDHTFDASMEEEFIPFLNAYNESGGDPLQMNLSTIKDQMAPSVRDIADLYIINETGIVIKTTYPEDFGLDFKTWPLVYQDISDIRSGSSFQADRAVYGFGSTKSTRKFAYYPTPDHRYLLEMSYFIRDFNQERRNFSYANFMRRFINETPHIQSLTLYDSMYRTLWDNKGVKTESALTVADNVKLIFTGRNETRIVDPRNASEIIYFFIGISDNTTVSGNMLDMVARIEYDTNYRQQHLNSLLLFHILVAVIAILLGIIIAYILAYHITRPIRRIIDDINRIARGDLSHRISYSGSPEFAELEDSLNLLISYVQDLVSSLQEKEHHLEESKERYQTLVEKLNEGIWIVDLNEKTTFVNTRMAEILESTPEKIVGSSAVSVIHPSSRDVFHQKVEKRHQGFSERYEISLLTLTGHLKYVEISATPSFDRDGKYLESFGVVTDISQRKENEQQIREYTLELEKRTHELEMTRDQLFRINEDLDRIVHDRTKEVMRLLEQKNDFIMQLGHDLRTPLTPILGLLPKLRELSGAEHDAVLDIIERNARHIQNIGSKSLKLARLNSLDYIPDNEIVHLSEVVSSVLDINRLALRNGGIITSVNVPEDCVIRGDLILIQELIDNLVSNSVKFSKPSGGHIHITGCIRDEMMHLTVSDTGIGLMPGEESAIFEEFYKSDRSRHDKSSTGLGLAICKKIVQKHHGTISAQSDGPDQGTIFTIILPVGHQNGKDISSLDDEAP